jgi:hypothetical protein
MSFRTEEQRRIDREAEIRVQKEQRDFAREVGNPWSDPGIDWDKLKNAEPK